MNEDEEQQQEALPTPGLITHENAGAPILHGGAGSGNFGHAGRMGEIGGSDTGGGGGSGSSKTRAARADKHQQKGEELSAHASELLAKHPTHFSGAAQDMGQAADHFHAAADLHEAMGNGGKAKELRAKAEQAEKTQSKHNRSLWGGA